MEKTAARKRDGAIPGSTGGGAAAAHRRRLACGTPAAEWPEPNGGTRIRRRACAGVARFGRGGRMIGLPSLQAMDRAQGARIWMASEATDMRCGFDRLAERVTAVIGEDPLSGHLFLFRSRHGDRDGFVVWYKRLEDGVFKLPRPREGARSMELRASELAMILDGIDVSKLKRVPRYERAVRSSE